MSITSVRGGAIWWTLTKERQAWCIYLVYKRRYINTLTFLSLSADTSVYLSWGHSRLNQTARWTMLVSSEQRSHCKSMHLWAFNEHWCYAFSFHFLCKSATLLYRRKHFVLSLWISLSLDSVVLTLARCARVSGSLTQISTISDNANLSGGGAILEKLWICTGRRMVPWLWLYLAHITTSMCVAKCLFSIIIRKSSATDCPVN